MTKNIIRIGEWSVDLDLDIITDGKKEIGLTSFKKQMIDHYPKLVEKYRLKSKLEGMNIRKIVAWDSLIEEAINKRIL